MDGQRQGGVAGVVPVTGSASVRLHAMPLWPGVSLTLLEDERGFRFNSWSHLLQPIAPPPSSDRERYFASAVDAAAHFRAICPRDL